VAVGSRRRPTAGLRRDFSASRHSSVMR
jgi:hypothetical protein